MSTLSEENQSLRQEVKALASSNNQLETVIDNF